ncbi:hypothetical protein Dred_0626 [Desulforamulus reducens MI-1]|uniref:Uncharacterized protein n=1 Tax=Desulforamulus reducens (strain ATCC BAA-1160 / DSM 100696 / MI-1) TaxID=349161 RepID=A4J263_DESRM|nr:hypothetical protein Dred_0626 [Desulforamulus reducens MI-1]
MTKFSVRDLQKGRPPLLGWSSLLFYLNRMDKRPRGLFSKRTSVTLKLNVISFFISKGTTSSVTVALAVVPLIDMSRILDSFTLFFNLFLNP